MRNVSAVLVLSVLVGCGGGRNLQPVDLSAPVRDANEVALECATRELENLGYETDETTGAGEQVVGVRINERPWFLRWLYSNTADQITASVDDGQLTVTALSTDPNGLEDTDPATTGASQAATENARTILETCGAD